MTSPINFKDYAIRLSVGCHTSGENELCLMEAVAFIQGEPHSDFPECSDYVISKYAQSLNDLAPQEQRDSLMPLVLKIAGSRGNQALANARVRMILAHIRQKLIEDLDPSRRVSFRNAMNLFSTYLETHKENLDAMVHSGKDQEGRQEARNYSPALMTLMTAHTHVYFPAEPYGSICRELRGDSFEELKGLLEAMLMLTTEPQVPDLPQKLNKLHTITNNSHSLAIA